MSEIPDKAEKVFEGVIFDVYQWKQEMFDGSEETFEMLKRPDTVCVIATDSNDKVLLIEQEQPHRGVSLDLPGGRVDAGESPELAAKRELREETGYESSDWSLWRSFNPLHKAEWTIYYYLARNAVHVADQSLDAGEKIAVRYVSIPEFVDAIAAGKIDAAEFENYILREILKGKRGEIEAYLSNRKN